MGIVADLSRYSAFGIVNDFQQHTLISASIFAFAVMLVYSSTRLGNPNSAAFLVAGIIALYDRRQDFVTLEEL